MPAQASDSNKVPTMHDVARVAGVSIGTVSHVLSRSHYVRPETRARVEVAVDELGFRPNRVARALVRRRTNTVAVVLPDITNPFFAELARGAEDVLGTADFAAVFGNSDNDPDKERRYLSNFGDRRVDGMIIVIAAETDGNEISDLAERMPTVAVDRVISGWRGDQVVGDNEAGMALAVHHLVELGHRRVALINGDRRLSTTVERRLGFGRALQVEGLQPVSMTDGAFTYESGFQQALELLGRSNRPTAVCATNDLLAFAVLAAASEKGCRIPQDLSVVGYDDIAFAKLASPSLTTVRQPAYDMGATAAHLLLERLQDDRRLSKRVVTKAELVVRGSTAAPRSDQ